jgi:8-amino-7-oxononanoate synthase
MNPIFLQTFYEAQNLFDQQLKKLRGNLRLLYTDVHLSEAFHFYPNYPVIYWHSDGVFEYLKSKNMIITNFKYPNYDTMMNRIVITANHTEADLEQLKSALRLF